MKKNFGSGIEKSSVSTETQTYFLIKVDIHLLFGMAKNPHLERSMKLKLDAEITKYNDVTIFDFEEAELCGFHNRCLIRNDIQIYRDIQHLCDGGYDSAYFVKTDNDVVLNYEMMARVFMDLPNESVYLGRLLPSFPIIRISRDVSDSSLDFDPVFAQGNLQGLSKDLLSKVLQKENVATVMRNDANYYHPESDRSLGIEFRRAQIPIINPVFMKGSNHICTADSFNCNNHWNSISFHSGFGHSGKSKTEAKTKMDMMKSIYKAQLQCSPRVTYNRDDHYVVFDDDILQNGNSSYWLSLGCSTLSQEASKLINELDQWTKELKENERPRNGLCADMMYSKQNQRMKNLFGEDLIPAFSRSVQSTENEHEFSNAFAKKMLETGSDEIGFESRLHFIMQGYRSPNLHYYCPDQCHADGSDFHKCGYCDMEAEYLKHNPDVALAVAKGSFASGFEHYVNSGSREGRTWSCQARYQPKETGTREGCEEVFKDFAESAKQKISDWPIGGSEDFQITPPTCNGLVIVDGRDDAMMEFVLRNHRRYLGPYWMFYLVAPKEVADKWREKYSGPMIEIVDIPEKYGGLSNYPDDYNNLLLAHFIWKDVVPCENILISQTDALLLRHGIEDFFIYDYAGSPIYLESHPTRVWSLIHAYNESKVGGNGGFSLRKRSAMLQALEECEITKTGSPEDAWTSACMMLLDRPMPHIHIANRFGVGTRCEIDVPLSTHKLWMNCKTSTCVDAIVASRFHKDVFGDENIERNCPEGETLYLRDRPDVAAEVAKGSFTSGWEHYNQYGRFEENGRWRCLTK